MPTSQDRRCDNRLTVIEVAGRGRKYTCIEAWATTADELGVVKTARVRFLVYGKPAVGFGCLVAFEVPGFATFYAHEDAPGESVRIRGEIRELGAIR